MTTRLTATSFDVMAVRGRFPALARVGADGRPFLWADAPGGSQTPDSVIEAVANRMAAGASIRWVDVRDEDVTLDLASFDQQLSECTRLVALTLASNAVGTVPPVAELVERAKAVGALVALDGVHYAQHRAIDLRAIGA